MDRSLLILVVVAVPSLCHCAACPVQGSSQAQAEDAANAAVYAAVSSKLGPLAGKPPAAAGSPDDPRCNGGGFAGPDEEPAALSAPPAGACTGSITGYGACVACVTEWCCTESVACFSEGTCTCLMGRATPGLSWPESMKCGAEGAVYAAAAACLSAHCATECPTQ